MLFRAFPSQTHSYKPTGGITIISTSKTITAATTSTTSSSRGSTITTATTNTTTASCNI